MPDVQVPDIILHHGLFTTLDRSNPTASAVAIKDGKKSPVQTDTAPVSAVWLRAGSAPEALSARQQIPRPVGAPA